MVDGHSKPLLERVRDGAVPPKDELVEFLTTHREQQRRIGRRAIAELATREPELIEELIADAAEDLRQDSDVFERGLVVTTAIARVTDSEFDYPVANLVATVYDQRGSARHHRYRAGTALVAIARDDQSKVRPHLEDLGRLLRDVDNVIRRVGCLLAAELDIASAHTDELLRLLDEGGVLWGPLTTALAAAGADTRVPAALITRLDDSENESRRPAAIALNKFAATDPTSVGDRLVPYLEDNNKTVQLHAALACARVSTQRPGMVSHHHGYLVDRAISAENPGVRAAGETIVAGLTENNPEAVGRHLGRSLDGTEIQRRRAATLTAELGEALPGVVAVQVKPLLECLNAQFATATREAAARALGHGGHRDRAALADAAEHLVDLHRDRLPAVANVAVMLLSIVADRAPTAFERAVEIHRDRLDTNDPKIVIDAVNALRALARGDPATVRNRTSDALTRLLQTDNPDITIAVCRALAELNAGDTDQLRTVATEADADDNQLVTAVARQSLARINRDERTQWHPSPSGDVDRVDIVPTPDQKTTEDDTSATKPSETDAIQRDHGHQRNTPHGSTAEPKPKSDRPSEHIDKQWRQLKDAIEAIDRLEYDRKQGPLRVFTAAFADGRQARLLTLDPEINEQASDAFVDTVHAWRATATHPNVIEVFEWGEMPTPWIATARPEGMRNLSDVANQLDIDESVSVLEKLAQAVQTARLYNTSHGDIRPGVVWLHHDGGEVVPRLDGWGLEATITESLGQPWIRPYTAPELVDPDQTGAGETSDVFGLGAVGYYLLTGTAPFPETDEPGKHIHQVKHGPEPPSEYGPSPPAVDEPILNALVADPTSRYERAQRFAATLRNALAKSR